MKILYVARHGETDYNQQGRYLGSTDIPLNASGKLQAEALASRLSDIAIDSILTSPLLRCEQTAQIVRKKKKTPIKAISALRERNVGVYEKLTKEEAQMTYPDLWEKNITRVWNDAPAGGETIQQVVKRVHRCLDKVLVECEGYRILIVTHGFVSKVINFYFNRDLSKELFFEFVLDVGNVMAFHPKKL